ncbi:hypothetical protein B0H13DRAFT_1873605 [Mycena leptocephala]|nr:hypothetical protein B0H13DRAFT_1873605 [Mycena leptocephala]
MPQAGPGLPLANLAALILQTLFYGMYFVIFNISMYLLFMKAKGHGSGKYTPVMKSMVFISAFALFFVVTVDWIIVVVRNFHGFIYFNHGKSADVYFNDSSGALSTVDNTFLALSIVIGDSMIIYRLWVVWSFNKIIVILPILSLLGLIGSLAIVVETTKRVPIQSISLEAALIPGAVFALVYTSLRPMTLYRPLNDSDRTNIYSTSFIAWKIWRTARDCTPVGGMGLRIFIAIAVESAAIYTSAFIFSVIMHQLNNTVQNIMLPAVPAILGIVNGLIHVRVVMGRTMEQVYGSATNSRSSRVTASISFAPPLGSMASGEMIALDRTSRLPITTY